MNQKVRTMLEKMYNVFIDKFHDPIKSWDRLVEFLAVDNCGGFIYQLNHKFEWLFQDSKLADTVMELYDPELLRSDYYDHLGDMYLEKIVSNKEAQRKGLFLTPVNLAELLAQTTFQKSNIPLKIFDPAVGTGRLLMAAYKNEPNSMLFGVDIDLRLLRIAMTNFAIHDIPGYLLHANSLVHEIDIATEAGRNNWQYANKWYSCIDKFEILSKGQNQRNQNPQFGLSIKFNQNKNDLLAENTEME